LLAYKARMISNLVSSANALNILILSSSCIDFRVVIKLLY
jgi:hypothetical protein